MASVISHTLAVVDQLPPTHSEMFRGDDVLKMMAVGLQPPEAATTRADEAAPTG